MSDLWDIFTLNSEEINSDFNILTQGRKISKTCRNKYEGWKLSSIY